MTSAGNMIIIILIGLVVTNIVLQPTQCLLSRLKGQHLFPPQSQVLCRLRMSRQDPRFRTRTTLIAHKRFQGGPRGLDDIFILDLVVLFVLRV